MIQKIDMLSTEFIPSEDLVLVKVEQYRMEEDKVSASGIIIEQGRIKSVNDRPNSGIVVTSGVKDLQPGDMVVFLNTDGQDVHFKDTDDLYLTDDLAQFIILRKNSVIGKKHANRNS